jgi:hypothetical protein
MNRFSGHFILLLTLLAGGCQVAGFVANAVGPPPVEAVYAPPKSPMLVLAENYANPSVGAIEAEQLERFVILELQAHGVAPMADYEKVYELRAADPRKFRSTPIDELGRLAGAAQVLYLSLQVSSTDVGQSSEVFQGRGAATVRVVDVETGQTVWPGEGSEGYPVRQDSQLVRAQPGVDDASVRRAVQQGLAEQIVKLFYKHEAEE